MPTTRGKKQQVDTAVVAQPPPVVVATTPLQEQQTGRDVDVVDPLRPNGNAQR